MAILGFIISCLITGGQAQETGAVISADQLKNDIQYLQKQLTSVHPALFRYIQPSVLRKFIDSLSSSITHPKTSLEFYSIISLIQSRIADGHTMILPDADMAKNVNASQKFLPFYFAVLGNRLYIRQNCSADSSIRTGRRVVSINSKKAEDIIAFLLERQSRDGYNSTYPVWIISQYFKEYYAFNFGYTGQFDIALASTGEKNEMIKVRALSKDSIQSIRSNRYSTNSLDQGIQYLPENKSSASLKISSFDPAFLKDEYDQDFASEIQQIFSKMKLGRVENLVLDLRDNQGGDFEPGRILLRHLITQPTEYLKGSDEYRRLTPAADAFKGKLVVLINGGSFSNTAIVASYLQLTRGAIIIGEESGGNRTVISGMAREFILPASRIRVYISTKNYIIRNGVNDGHGVIPQITIEPSIGQILSREDAVKKMALSLLSSGN